MDNQNQDADESEQSTNEVPQLDEKAALKARADMLGVKYGNNISVETLRAKVQAAIDGEAEEPEDEPASQASPLGEVVPERETEQQLRARLHREQMKLVRIRITCMNPGKKDLPGEIFTVANEYLGTVRKYVPFDIPEEGYHVPYVIYTLLEERKFLNIRTVKDRVTKQERQETSWVKEFSIEVLPQLTEQELATLAAAQRAAGSIDAHASQAG